MRLGRGVPGRRFMVIIEGRLSSFNQPYPFYGKLNDLPSVLYENREIVSPGDGDGWFVRSRFFDQRHFRK